LRFFRFFRRLSPERKVACSNHAGRAWELPANWQIYIEFSWSRPAIVRFYEHLSSFYRLILFDKRGTGLSDPVAGMPTMEDRLADMRGV
jgi:pimeloyl-ACP methyl ester carboxylesterase